VPLDHCASGLVEVSQAHLAPQVILAICMQKFIVLELSDSPPLSVSSPSPLALYCLLLTSRLSPARSSLIDTVRLMFLHISIGHPAPPPLVPPFFGARILYFTAMILCVKGVVVLRHYDY